MRQGILISDAQAFLNPGAHLEHGCGQLLLEAVQRRGGQNIFGIFFAIPLANQNKIIFVPRHVGENLRHVRGGDDLRVGQQVFDVGAHLQGVPIGSLGLNEVCLALRETFAQILKARRNNVLALFQRNRADFLAIILQSLLGRLQFFLLPFGFQLKKCVGALGGGVLRERVLCQIIVNQRIDQPGGKPGIGVSHGNINQTRVAAQRCFDVTRKLLNGFLARRRFEIICHELSLRAAANDLPPAPVATKRRCTIFQTTVFKIIQPAHIFGHHLLGFDDFCVLLFHFNRGDRFIDARGPFHISGGGNQRQHDAGNNQPAFIPQNLDDAVQIHDRTGRGECLRTDASRVDHGLA